MLKEISNDIRSAFQSNQNGVVQLLVVNIVVFLIGGTAKVFSKLAGTPSLDPFIQNYLELSSDFVSLMYHPWTLLTYSVMHLGLTHFIFNMLGLYWFGQILQDFLGPKRVVQFYIAGALSGGLLFLLIFNLTGENHLLLGASGSVYGIICGAAFLVPNYTMNLLFFGPVRLKYIATAFVLISFLEIAGENPGGNIAHLGGALGGILFLKYLQGSFTFPTIRKPQPKLKGKVVQMESVSKKHASEQDELDVLLDKISEKGIQNLTKEERTRLEHLSKPTNTNE